MKYTPQIFVTVDNVIVKQKSKNEVFILLIKRKNEPFKNLWALPGGFVDKNENLADAAIRELKEETSIDIKEMKQVGAFGEPDRDPRGHTISIAYFAIVPIHIVAKAADDAKEVKWFNIDELPSLAFDHNKIINLAKKRFLKE